MYRMASWAPAAKKETAKAPAKKAAPAKGGIEVFADDFDEDALTKK